MSLTTFSTFYYGHTITDSNQYLDFDEGGDELTATIAIGTYSLEEFAVAVKTALDAAGALTYTVSVNRATRVMTISAGSNFSLLVTSGSHVGVDAYSLLGFTGADQTGASTYSGDSASGSAFTPQFILQDHVSTDDNQGAIDETVNISASGTVVEVIKFGTEKFMECKIRYQTNIAQPSVGPITNNASGISQLRNFMQYLITKAPIEFMPDKDSPSTFQTFILESTGESQNGTAYKLRERYDLGLPGYFDTSLLKFRLIE